MTCLQITRITSSSKLPCAMFSYDVSFAYCPVCRQFEDILESFFFLDDFDLNVSGV